MAEGKVQQEVRQFYDAVGWQQVSDGVYQNAQYEDLRPVSREYIHKCHLRINRYLRHSGKYLLDAGSGPIQYPEYLSYSEGYKYRICLDISIVALKEARDRIKNQGLFVVGDIAQLPFKNGSIDDVVSLHTIHHLPPEDYKPAFLVSNV
jgi:SAM-dependent methyltransferase